MTWIFAVLVVLVMGGVAVVASGRGGSMAPAYDDRPDSLVPAGRRLTAADVRQVRLGTAFRGYRMSEVDALLDRLAAELEAASRPGTSQAPDGAGLMVRVRIERHVDVDRPAAQVWDYVTDWPRQAEWVPQTRVENLDTADRLGGRFRAWTGVGPVGFWDPMTITSWERDADGGGGRCEVLHRGTVVKGEGEFAVESLSPDRSRFVWAEMVVVPGGRPGALAWRVARPVVERLIDLGLRRMRDKLEHPA